MIIETWWNKVGPANPATGLATVLHGEYERKSRVKMRSGWSSIDDFGRYARKSPRFLGEDGGQFKFDLGSSYGVHSYQVVYFSE